MCLRLRRCILLMDSVLSEDRIAPELPETHRVTVCVVRVSTLAE